MFVDIFYSRGPFWFALKTESIFFPMSCSMYKYYIYIFHQVDIEITRLIYQSCCNAAPTLITVPPYKEGPPKTVVCTT